MKTFLYAVLTMFVFMAVSVTTCIAAGVHPWIAGAVAVFSGGCYFFGLCLALTSEGPNWRWPVNAGIVGVCAAFAYLLTSGTVAP